MEREDDSEAELIAQAQYDKDLGRLSNESDAAAANLCDVQPTTIAGASALLNYYAEVMIAGDGEDWPDYLVDKEDGSEKPFGHFLARNVARALGNILAGSETVRS
jgi:hypothetical protein